MTTQALILAICVNIVFIGFMIWWIRDEIKEINRLKKIEKGLDEKLNKK